MKNSWFLFLCLLFSASLAGQVKIVGVQAVLATDRDGRGMIMSAKEIQGSPYVGENWYDGSVVYSNGISAKVGMLNFDLYSNKPTFREGDGFFHFRDPIREIRYEAELNGKPKTMVFRNEYPAVGNQDKTFYYRVEEDGPKFQLLQLLEKVVYQEMVTIAVYEKKFVQQEEWYLFDAAAGKLIKLPKSKKDLAQAVNGLSPELAAYIKSKSPNPKDAESMAVMVRVLNSQ